MLCKNEIEYLAALAQDFIRTLPGSAQVAVTERAQHCLNQITMALTGADPLEKPKASDTPESSA